MPDSLALPVLAAAALLFAVMAAVWATAVRIHNAGIVDIAWSANFTARISRTVQRPSSHQPAHQVV